MSGYTFPSAIYPDRAQIRISNGIWSDSPQQNIEGAPFRATIPDGRSNGNTVLTNLTPVSYVGVDTTVEKTRWETKYLYYQSARIDPDGRLVVTFEGSFDAYRYQAIYAGYPTYNVVGGTGQTNTTQGVATTVIDISKNVNFSFPGGNGGPAPTTAFTVDDGPLSASIQNNGTLNWSYKYYNDVTENIPVGTRKINVKVPAALTKVVATLGGQSYTVDGGTSKLLPVSEETSVVFRVFGPASGTNSFQLEFLGGTDIHDSTDWEISLSPELEGGQPAVIKEETIPTVKTPNNGYATGPSGTFIWTDKQCGIAIRGKGGDGTVSAGVDTRTYTWTGEIPYQRDNINEAVGTGTGIGKMPSVRTSSSWKWTTMFGWPWYNDGTGDDIWVVTSGTIDIDPSQVARFGGRSQVTLTHVPNVAMWDERWTAGREDRELSNYHHAPFERGWVDANGWLWMRFTVQRYPGGPTGYLDYGGPVNFSVSGGSVSQGSTGNGAASTVMGVSAGGGELPGWTFEGGGKRVVNRSQMRLTQKPDDWVINDLRNWQDTWMMAVSVDPITGATRSFKVDRTSFDSSETPGQKEAIYSFEGKQAKYVFDVTVSEDQAATMSDWVEYGSGPLTANFVNNGTIEYRAYTIDTITQTIPAGAAKVKVTFEPAKIKRFAINYGVQRFERAVDANTAGSWLQEFDVATDRAFTIEVFMNHRWSDTTVKVAYIDKGEPTFKTPLRRSMFDRLSLKLWAQTALQAGQTYYVRARHRGAMSSATEWSDVVQFTVKGAETAAVQHQTDYQTSRQTEYLSTAEMVGGEKLTTWQTDVQPYSVPAWHYEQHGMLANFPVEGLPEGLPGVDLGTVRYLDGTDRANGQPVRMRYVSSRDVVQSASISWRYLRFEGVLPSNGQTAVGEYGMTVYTEQPLIRENVGVLETVVGTTQTQRQTADETPVKSAIAYVSMTGITGITPPATVTHEQLSMTVPLAAPLYVKQTGNVSWKRMSGDAAVWPATTSVPVASLELSADNGFLARRHFINPTNFGDIDAYVETSWFEMRNGERWQMAKYSKMDNSSSAVYGYPTFDHSKIFNELVFDRKIYNATTYPGRKLVRFENADTNAYMDYEFSVSYGTKQTSIQTGPGADTVTKLTEFYTEQMTEDASSAP